MTPSITVPSGNSKLWYQPFRARSALKSFSFRRFSLSDNSCGAITHSYRSACIGSIHANPEIPLRAQRLGTGEGAPALLHFVRPRLVAVQQPGKRHVLNRVSPDHAAYRQRMVVGLLQFTVDILLYRRCRGRIRGFFYARQIPRPAPLQTWRQVGDAASSTPR